MRTIGIDLGGTKTLAVLVEDGVVVEKAKRPTPRAGSPDEVLATMAKVAASVDPDATATAIGIGAPGPVVPGTGVLSAAPNLPGWDHDVPVAHLMSERLGGRPVVVGNDVNVGTLAEHRLGAGKGVDDLLGVFAGTGVGAASSSTANFARVLVGSPVRSATSSSHSVTSPSKLKDSVAVNSRITQAARRSSAVSSPPVPPTTRRCLRCDPMAASSRKPGPWRSR